MTEPGDDDLVIPGTYLREILRRTEDLAELKVILLVAQRTRGMTGQGVSLVQLQEPATTRAIVGRHSPEPAEVRLQRAVERAVANGSLLRLTVRQGSESDIRLWLATAPNRALLEALRRDEPGAGPRLGIHPADEVTIYRPNVFALYERNIGPLTPLLAEQLRDAERSYPRAWLEEAIREAVEYNRRNWRYIASILARWEVAGGPDRAPRRDI
jgi:DNA replication protein